MPRDRVPSFGFILSVVLAAAGGCRRPHPLSVPPGVGAEPRDGAITGSDVRTPLDDGAHDVSDAAVALDANGLSDAADVLAVTPDASTAATPDAGSDGGRVPYRAIGVATGEVHTCALLDDHRVKCWGNNSFGQLGYGDTRDRGGTPADMGDNLPTVDLGSGRTAVVIAAARYGTCAILDDGSAKCWGQGFAGAATTGDIGVAPDQMGDHLTPLDFGGRRAVHLAMGESSACASLEDDTIWCWPGGDGMPWLQFWLPAKPVTALAPSGGGLVALYDDGSVSPMLPNGGTVPMFTSDHKVLAVAGAWGAAATTCYLLDDGTTTCSEGTDGPANAIAIGVERDRGLCSAFADGSVRCDSQNCVQPTYYQCSSDGSFALGAPAVIVTSNGSQFACALLSDGNIKCWADYPSGPLSVWLGCEFDTIQSDGGITYGAWHPVDLGTHP
jgi:hypothetical protein